jgi:uncharacterized protein (TIGR03435 family)
MTFSLWARTALLAAGLAPVVAAQQTTAGQGTPRFEVISIRPVPSNASPIMLDINFTPVGQGGQYIHPRAGLFEMISFAYNMQILSWEQLVGLPNWAKTQTYSVAAKPAETFPSLPADQNSQQVRLMMRGLLADRFQLQLHIETRNTRVLKLEVTEGGIKLKEVAPPVPPAKEGYVGIAAGDNDGHIVGTKSTMAGLAKALTVFLEHPVIDQTGLKGYYDFDMKWGAATGRSSDSSFGAEGAGILISFLQERFGLRLTNATNPLQFWVVDHMEPPPPN